MRLLLIAGHGAADPGAVATMGAVQYREAVEARTVVAAVAKALRGYADVTVYDTQRNAYADYKAGTLRTLAQFAKYDYVLEVHFNAAQADPGDGKTKGVECYVTTQEPGTAVEEAMVQAVASLGLRNRGVKRKNWSVIAAARAAGASAALLEVCFLDDADDMAVYLRDRQAVAIAIAGGLVQGFGLTKPAAEDREDDNMQTIYERLEDVPGWARPTVEKLMARGLLQGEGKALNLEYHMLRGLVINDRAGLYDK